MKRKKERRNTSSPMSWSGPHYQDYKLEEVDSQTIKTKRTWKVGANKSYFFLAAGIALFISIPILLGPDPLLGAALSFVVIASILLFVLPPPYRQHFERVFNKTQGFYMAYTKGELYSKIPLDEIASLQILSKKCKFRLSYYNCYELNGIVKINARFPILNHGNLQAIRDDAQMLSKFLGVPIYEKLGG
jgi:hypothetical protein